MASFPQASPSTPFAHLDALRLTDLKSVKSHHILCIQYHEGLLDLLCSFLCVNVTYTALTTQKYAHPNALFVHAN